MDVGELILNIEEHILNPLIGILFALALAIFLWGIARFIFQSDDESAREQGKQHIIWGLVGMFIMVSVFAIIHLIVGTFDIPPPDLPYR
ncbi:MAG: pilin [Patescibacteria group bacterium]|nr:pilin [Patescibacteria group bacterium]